MKDKAIVAHPDRDANRSKSPLRHPAPCDPSVPGQNKEVPRRTVGRGPYTTETFSYREITVMVSCMKEKYISEGLKLSDNLSNRRAILCNSVFTLPKFYHNFTKNESDLVKFYPLVVCCSVL